MFRFKKEDRELLTFRKGWRRVRLGDGLLPVYMYFVHGFLGKGRRREKERRGVDTALREIVGEYFVHQSLIGLGLYSQTNKNLLFHVVSAINLSR